MMLFITSGTRSRTNTSAEKQAVPLTVNFLIFHHATNRILSVFYVINQNKAEHVKWSDWCCVITSLVFLWVILLGKMHGHSVTKCEQVHRVRTACTPAEDTSPIATQPLTKTKKKKSLSKAEKLSKNPNSSEEKAAQLVLTSVSSTSDRLSWH